MSNVLKISEAASLALHTMVLLAVPCDGIVTTREIAATIKVSEAHLSKVLQRLVRVGLVKSTRGPKGGFCLERSGDEITLLEVYEAIEGKLTPCSCLLGTPICGGEKCILGGLIETVNKQVREYLSQSTLSELIDVYRNKNAEEKKDNSNYGSR